MSSSQSSSSTGLPVSRRPATMPRRRTSLFSGEIPGRRAYMQRRASWATLSIQSSCKDSSAQVSSTRTVSIYSICLAFKARAAWQTSGVSSGLCSSGSTTTLRHSASWATRSGVRASGAASTPNAHLGNAFARLAASEGSPSVASSTQTKLPFFSAAATSAGRAGSPQWAAVIQEKGFPSTSACFFISLAP